MVKIAEQRSNDWLGNAYTNLVAWWVPKGAIIAEKVLERLATSDRTTIVIEKQPEGKMQVTSGSWDSEKVFLKDQVLEVRHAIRRRLATCGSQNQALRRLGPAL
jgi:hypothetical protein